MRRIYYAGVERALVEGGVKPVATGRVPIDYLAYFVTLPALMLGYRRGRRMLKEGSSTSRPD